MDVAQDFTQLQLRFVDQLQWRYELIRPLVLFAERPARQRAEATHTHPETVRQLRRRCHHQGRLGLLLDDVAVAPKDKAARVPAVVLEEIPRLKALYTGCQYRALARILLCTTGYRMDHKTGKRLWHHSPVAAPGELPWGDSHSHPERYQARVQVLKLYAQGWTKRSIRQFLHVSRPTVKTWIRRFETEYFAGLVDPKRGPKAPRKVWFPIMVQSYHLQKAHPDAGECRIWSLLASEEISGRTGGRVMARNRPVYDDSPHGKSKGPKPPAQPHPDKATGPHPYWCIDGRKRDVALDGVKWWSLIMLEGYSRTMLAGAVAPAEASWVALMGLYTACLRYGAPETLISDRGGAFISAEFTAVCQRLGIHHAPIKSTQGQSYLHGMETHFNVQRRLVDYQFS